MNCLLILPKNGLRLKFYKCKQQFFGMADFDVLCTVPKIPVFVYQDTSLMQTNCMQNNAKQSQSAIVPVTKRSEVMATAIATFRNALADWDIECDSIPPKHTETSLAMIRYVQYPIDHTHLRVKKKTVSSC